MLYRFRNSENQGGTKCDTLLKPQVFICFLYPINMKPFMYIFLSYTRSIKTYLTKEVMITLHTRAQTVFRQAQMSPP